MATLAGRTTTVDADNRFYLTLVLLMATVLVAGFSFNLGMGRSTFSAPLVWHLHAVVFFGWTALVVTQTWFATRGPMAVHRRLGWLSVVWLPLMAVLAPAVTIATIRRGTAPFFFMPQHFLVVNILSFLAVVAIVALAIRLRRSTDWHRRLQIVAFAGLLGPGFGRLLPMPLFVPWAFEVSIIAGLLFPAYAMAREQRREGRIHPAWWTGIAMILGALIVAEFVALSPLGTYAYALATEGAPSATPGLAYGTPPPGM